jgi:hypothetical protein
MRSTFSSDINRERLVFSKTSLRWVEPIGVSFVDELVVTCLQFESSPAIRASFCIRRY